MTLTEELIREWARERRRLAPLRRIEAVEERLRVPSPPRLVFGRAFASRRCSAAMPKAGRLGAIRWKQCANPAPEGADLCPLHTRTAERRAASEAPK